MASFRLRLSLASAQGLTLCLSNLHKLTSLEDFMEYFRLDHPPDRLILCNRSNCEDIADYIEVNEQTGEEFVCAAHTSSQRHASVLPNGVPSGGATPHENRPAA